MGINLGSLNIADVFLGSTQITAVYQGSNLIWQKGPVTDEPFYVTSDEAFDIQLTQTGTVNAVPEISTDLSAWLTLAPGYAYSYQAGQKVYVRNVASNDWSLNSSNYLSFNTGCTFKTVGGNAKSLINNSGTLPSFCFKSLFEGNTYIKDITDLKLPWMTMQYNCYRSMFYRCSSLTDIPLDLLPATTLEVGCYRTMFSECSSLQTPCRLPATGKIPGGTNEGAYQWMFDSTAINKLPKINWTDADIYACYQMFAYCSNIKISTTQTGEYQNEYHIPAGYGSLSTTDYSYWSMFTNTGGTFAGSPSTNTTYYTSNEVIS